MSGLQNFKLDELAPFTREGEFAGDDSPDFRAFYVGRDDVHEILVHLLSLCSISLKLNMFGYDDDELDAIIQKLVHDPHTYVQGTLDRSQAGGVHEKKILAGWDEAVRASFAIGTSSTHQISHTKGGVIDGTVGFEGSTNWSASGEGAGIVLGKEAKQAPGFKAQNNTLLVYTNPPEIIKFSAELDDEHTTVLQQQKARPEKKVEASSTTHPPEA